jgi:hypothetical protein
MVCVWQSSVYRHGQQHVMLCAVCRIAVDCTRCMMLQPAFAPPVPGQTVDGCAVDGRVQLCKRGFKLNILDEFERGRVLTVGQLLWQYWPTAPRAQRTRNAAEVGDRCQCSVATCSCAACLVYCHPCATCPLRCHSCAACLVYCDPCATCPVRCHPCATLLCDMAPFFALSYMPCAACACLTCPMCFHALVVPCDGL